MTSSNSNNDSFSTDEQGVEIRSHHVEEGDVLAMTQTDAHSNGNVANTNNTKGGLGNTAVKFLCGTAVLATVGSASYGAGVNSTVAKMNSVVTSQKAAAGKSDKSKAGKKVCLEYAFVNDVVIKGSENPLQGPTGATPACLGDATKCFTPVTGELAQGGDYFSGSCKKWLKCLENNPKDDGPAFNNPWFMNRDVTDGQIIFEDGRVCARIPTDNGNGKARMELWDPTYLNEPLDRFRQFKVPYDIVATSSGSNAYVNVYLRVNKDSTQYYDCNLTFEAPTSPATGAGEILIDLTTPSDSARKRTGADNTGCTTGNTLQQYIDDNNGGTGAVMGVGNKEWYTFAINDGSTGQSNAGLSVCK